MEKRRPLVAQVKHNSLDDGPGIRTTVFLKGCPLSCVWCHNPECVDPRPQLMYKAKECVGCGTCIEACSQQAIAEKGPAHLDRSKCVLCGDCAEQCPSGALSIIGAYREVEALAEVLLRDKALYANSAGGVTLSGGEPTMFMDYAAAVCQELKEEGVHVCVETCGDFEWDAFARKLLPLVDLVYVDLKIVDEAAHREFTGKGNRRILENIENLKRDGGIELLVRIPLVPGVNTGAENLTAAATWLAERGIDEVALLPYNPLWPSKAIGLGIEPKYQRDSWMSAEEEERARSYFSDFKIR